MDAFTWNCNIPVKYIQKYQSVRVCSYDTISGVNFQFIKETLRFLLSQTQIQGYLINGKDADTNTIYAGTCQKF